ncbi:hypothetical protein D3C84_841810 [compost metagenome]
MGNGVAAVTNKEVIHQVDGGPWHQEIQQHDQEGIQQRNTITFDRQHASQQDDADGEDRHHTSARRRGDFFDGVDTSQQCQHGAVGVECDDRQESHNRHQHQCVAQARND